ncbi:zinc finger and SCAN domain-containing protein 12-like [Topomyia yanbarensis]|uniref:zinc finger and SCAN domain-containing protein 12-like n=1 Tax=Topomyia yanbarensis TaxID=2498891 RepID=UPI00273AAE40|nr:zinc finger and SCAN domain-containing protein 12-like [Topomyia yanbarensis]
MESRRSTRKVKVEPSFELVDVKLEPDDLLNSTKTEEITAGASKRKYVRSRAIQVKPEDLDGLAGTNMDASMVPGENEPIDLVYGETIVPQCRFCLRRVSRPNLKIILARHKPKTLAAFKIKIFPGDAYPLACCNCLNLLDIILGFKEAVLKAKKLLIGDRTFLESDGWDDSECMDAIAKCRTVVEQHKKQIDSTYEEFLKRRVAGTLKEEKEIDNANEGLQAAGLQDDSAQVLSAVSVLVEQSTCLDSSISETVQEEPLANSLEENDEQEDSADAGDESDFLPPTDSEDEEFEEAIKKSKKSKKVKKTRASRETASNRSSNKEQEPRQELCDLCGERVCSQAAESHKNRHLGIKPYTCPSEGCELTFYSRFNQLQHVKRIHAESGVPSHKCDICGRNIRGALNVLNWHKRKHDQTKKHVCQFCGKGFTLRQYLKQHVTVVHTEVFPHACSYCGKKFKLKWSMLAHEKNVHEKKYQAASAQEQQVSDCGIQQEPSYDYVTNL